MSLGFSTISGGAALLVTLFGAGAAASQLLPSLPPVGGVVREIDRLGDRVLDEAGQGVRAIGALAEDRIDRLRGLVRANPRALEMTGAGPAVRGEVVAIDPDEATIAAARKAGFSVAAEETIDGIGLRTVTLRTPAGIGLDRAVDMLRKAAPHGTFTANHLHFQAGSATGSAAEAGAGAAQSAGSKLVMGLIDGGVAEHPALPGTAEQRGFARGAPVSSAHGTAVASLAVGAGLVRGAAPRAHLLVADVYGRDPAGGNAAAIARALGWMAERRVPVVAMSLVGPSNSLVERAVAGARSRGVQIVAPVGNDGPAAPLAFPASYPGVVAVTAVDGRNRALPEAGRASHLDYAAPGADMAAATIGRRIVRARGTSYAVPLVAGRMLLAASRGEAPIRALDGEAKDLGPSGPDKSYGRGLVCGGCRTPMPKK